VPRARAARALLTVLHELSAVNGAGLAFFLWLLCQEEVLLVVFRVLLAPSPRACLLARLIGRSPTYVLADASPCNNPSPPRGTDNGNNYIAYGRLLRHRCVVREDGKGEVVIAGLEEKEAMDAEGLESLIADGNRNRTTHATESNDQSSRSVGRMGSPRWLVDLAPHVSRRF